MTGLRLLRISRGKGRFETCPYSAGTTPRTPRTRCLTRPRLRRTVPLPGASTRAYSNRRPLLPPEISRPEPQKHLPGRLEVRGKAAEVLHSNVDIPKEPLERVLAIDRVRPGSVEQ